MEDNLRAFVDEFINILKVGKRREINNLKKELAEKYGLVDIPKNNVILSLASDEDRVFLKRFLNIKPVRSVSGVTVVAVFARPFPCPHGRCIYCPGGPSSDFGDVPQSYTGREPATMRAILNDYDPYLQVFNRLEHYVVNGHFPDKIEIIIMGGTFPSIPQQYKDEFVTYVYKAINDFADLFVKNNDINMRKFNQFFLLPSKFTEERSKEIKRRVLRLKGCSRLGEEIKRNERSSLRVVGLTIETRPDWAKLEHINGFLKYGCTRVELGVQSIFEDVLDKVRRGHTVKDTIESFQLLKDTCFKINAHVMIGLPGSSKEKDKKNILGLFSNQNFRPDMLKIYPTLVVKGTKLYEMYRNNKYVPLTTEEAAKIIAEVLPRVPKYVRVMRIQRDIPTGNIEAGVTMSNLRQYVLSFLDISNLKEIRSREVGIRLREGFSMGTPLLKVMKYKASQGIEYFISVEDEYETLIGFLRLRLPCMHNLRPEITEGTALIRELHVYGVTTRIGEVNEDSFQHKGWGRKLLKKAEDIAREQGYNKIVVISGVGVREYYRKCGYCLEGPYMVKRI